MADNILRSRFSDVYIPTHMTLAEFVMRQVATFGDEIALIDPISSRQFTFSEVCQYVKNVAAGLYQRGVRKGDVLCLCSPNSIEYPIAFHAANSIGAIVTTVNPAYTSGELRAQLIDSKARYIITIPSLVDMVNTASAGTNITGKILFEDGLSQPGYWSFSKLMAEGGLDPPPMEVNAKEDVCCLPYSSGTTGKPKGVMLTHYNLIANLCQATNPDMMKALSPYEASIGVVPYFHMFGVYAVLIRGLYTGARMIVMRKFDLKLYLECIQNYKVPRLVLVPPLAVLLSKHPLVSKYDLSSVTMISSGAAPLSASLISDLKLKLTNITDITQGYGLTETSPVVSSPYPPHVSGSSGKIVSGSELKVIHLETGAAQSSYAEGEICVRGPHIMKGYLNNEEATRACIDTTGWFHTGDIGYYDKDGNIFIIDRLKELVKYKGFQVAPAELESILLSHPSISDAAVVGVPDEMAGELPRAYVVLKPGAKATAEELIQLVQGQVAPHKRLRGGVRFLKEVPKSASGKIMRRLLKQQALSNSKL